jgi:tRNA-guanine family transglycosylase
MAKEMLSATLLSIHNLHTLIQLTREMRASIQVGTFAEEFKELLVGSSR